MVNLKRNKKDKLVHFMRKRVKQDKVLHKGTYNLFIKGKLQRNGLLSRQQLEGKFGDMEKHHITPKHQGGSDQEKNLILLTKKEHMIAHKILYMEFAQEGDLKAFILRLYSEDFDLKSHGKKMAALNQILKRTFWNSKVQQSSGRKGGRIRGSRNTSSQRNARSQVGITYGRTTGIGNQSEQVTCLLKNIFVFSHKSEPELEFFVGPSDAVIDLARELNKQCQEQNLKISVPLEKLNGGPFYGLVKGTKPSAYGWIIKEIQNPTELLDLLQD